MMRQLRMPGGLIAGFLITMLLTGCGSGRRPEARAGAVDGSVEKVTLRLGYFPNLTHAPALVGTEKGIYAEKLGPGVTLATNSFNAGPAAVEAIFSGAVDATYVGPNPAINAFAKSGGRAIRIIAGAASGGAFLVVDPTIQSPAGLKGRKIATPQLGNTQDVALRRWLKANGLSSDVQGGGDVSVIPQDNGQTLEAFKAGAVAGAWVPEPWATRMVQEGGGRVLVDESTLWAGGRYVTTHLVVRTKFLEEHPDVVRRLLEGHVAAVDFLNADADEAKATVNLALRKLTGRGIAPGVIDAAWPHIAFTNDPVAASLRKGAADAVAVGLLDRTTKLDGIYDLTLLNRVLRSSGQPEVQP